MDGLACEGVCKHYVTYMALSLYMTLQACYSMFVYCHLLVMCLN